MTMTVYSSADGSAPALGNSNGSLINLLDKCLVAGYGAKAAAGWTKPYTGTNLAVFKQGTGGNNRYLRVFDATNTPDYRRANFRAYESMTAVSTGTNPFPTTTQVTGNGQTMPYWNLSSTGNSVWTLYATESFFWLLVTDAFPPSGYLECMAFGTFFSEKSGDTFNDVLIAGPTPTTATPTQASGFPCYFGTAGVSGTGIYVCRNDSGTVGAKDSSLRTSIANSTAGSLGGGDAANFPYPNRVKSSLVMGQPVLWCDGYPRGRLPGLWESAHMPAALGGNGTTWSGTGAISAKSFRFYGPISPSYIGSGNLVIETTNTWN